ncbi:flagellar assembly protein FliW [Halalkalibacter krulwichiae]|uniref:Flagellar assembly factor FliW n=1 Tax=Halalkalibacter krulwichiae TaxID=199441 RepID=A0A1X9MF68_9BACI|nr:flagellar assembly protein FliW [Halalkalibacter krulwichiae]ARK32095.1 Flagellar assembly factor FliW [Halalkalibacter krulwichiae]
MNIETKYQGTINIHTENILTFSQGIPAFEDEKQFILLPFDEGTPFFVLQSIKSVNVAFIMMNPFEVVPNYEVKLPDATIEQLEIEKQEDVATFVVLTVKDPFEETTANLQGPIIINANKKKGKQLLLSDTDYQTKHQIFKQAAVTAKEGK